MNGICVGPNSCECDDDYQMDFNITDWNVCHPICNGVFGQNNACINGICTEPDTCQCSNGFEPSLDANFTCNPIVEETSNL